MPSSAWMRLTSKATRRANCSGVDTSATATSPSACANSWSRWAAGSSAAGAGDDVDVRSSRCTVTQRASQLGCRRKRPGTLRRLHRSTQRRLRRFRDPSLGEAVSRQLRHQRAMLGVGPCLHLTHRHQTRLDQIIARRSIVEHRNNAMHTLDNSNRIHTTNHREGVSQSSPVDAGSECTADLRWRDLDVKEVGREQRRSATSAHRAHRCLEQS